MNKQEIFDKVATHLLAQGCKANRSNVVPAYRGENNTKCAIGCLIPDYMYLEKMEGETVDWLCSVDEEIANTIEPADLTWHEGMNFLMDLQNIHDNCSPDIWRALLQGFAVDHQLNTGVIEE